jgi:Fungal specific transcription factor domain
VFGNVSKPSLATLLLCKITESGTRGEVCAVLNSCFILKPFHPPLRFHEQYIAAVKKWATTSPPSSIQPLGKAFRNFTEYGITDTMLEVLECMEAITLAIDHYLQGKPGGLTLGQIVRTRTGIQKRLLLLPTAKELNISINIVNKPSCRSNLYECCHLTAMIFSIAVIFPIPSTYDVLQTLVRELIASLEVTDIESYSEDCSGVLLWMLVLGGIAALDKPERPWFVSNLVLSVERLKLDWDGAEAILKTFLWLESACSPGGRQLWDEVMSFIG